MQPQPDLDAALHDLTPHKFLFRSSWYVTVSERGRDTRKSCCGGPTKIESRGVRVRQLGGSSQDFTNCMDKSGKKQVQIGGRRSKGKGTSERRVKTGRRTQYSARQCSSTDQSTLCPPNRDIISNGQYPNIRQSICACLLTSKTEVEVVAGI